MYNKIGGFCECSANPFPVHGMKHCRGQRRSICSLFGKDEYDMEGSLKTIGVLTSGGDAPGMNACIRAVVRSALNRGCRVMGIRKGYSGLLKGDVMEMSAGSVADIIHRGGTILYTARCPEFMQVEYQDRAAEMCRIFGIGGLVIIGGDGSFKGAQKLSQRGISVVGVPGTIDRDIACSEYTIGFDTAVNIAVEAVARLRDTSASHERCSVCLLYTSPSPRDA